MYLNSRVLFCGGFAAVERRQRSRRNIDRGRTASTSVLFAMHGRGCLGAAAIHNHRTPQKAEVPVLVDKLVSRSTVRYLRFEDEKQNF
jgi:hypothetical protein